MAKKKTPPAEESEQLQEQETMNQPAGQAEVDSEINGVLDATPAEPPNGENTGRDRPAGNEVPNEAAAEDAPSTEPYSIAEPVPAAGPEPSLGSEPSAEPEQAPEIPSLELPKQTDEDLPVVMPDESNTEDEDDSMEVMSVDLSEPAPLPDGDKSTPEELDSLLEDKDSMPVRPTMGAAPTTAETTSNAGDEKPSAPEMSDRQKFYALKFNRLDRNLTPEERQEWNSIYASYRGRSALTGTIIGIDPFSVQVRNRETGEMEKQTMYCAIVVPYRVRIVIPASEMWEKDKARPDFVLQNMVGSVIDFIIIKVDREAGFAIGSRRLACRSQRYFFAHRPNLNAIGTRVKCRMLSVGPRRCLVECYGHDIGLTQREMRYTAIPDLRDEYHPGQELDCIVKLYDPDTDRLEVSIKETESNPFDGAEQRHPPGARRLALIAGKYGGGVFCNLPDDTVCMCNYSYQHEDSDFMVGDHVMLIVQRYETDKEQMYGKILTKW